MPDALDRLKRRKRPKVTQRDASLSASSVDIQTPRRLDTPTSEPEASSTSASPAIPTSGHPDSSTTETPDTSKSRHLDIQTPPLMEEELRVKRSTFRMEEALTERLHSLCREKKISREVLMEAMFEYMEVNPEAMGQVLTVAAEKHTHRQQIANRKRAEAMMQKFGGR
ncbi:MAG: hypothetical protein AAGH78_00640 [Cyanobacteria bacterium P01_H01_bin.58]